MNQIIHGDSLEVLKTLEDESVDCIITSPPYWGLRDYGASGQIGQESTLDEYVKKLLLVTAELMRVLKKEGTLWWNHGDSYGGTGKKGDARDPKFPDGRNGQQNSVSANFMPKSLLLQPYRLALRMCDEQGWILRNQIIWHKPNVMPTPVTDRFTVDFEPVFLFSKSQKYNFEPQYEPLAESSIERAQYGFTSGKANGTGIDIEQMGERFVNPRGRNKRTTWTIPTSNSEFSHVAMFPKALIEPMVMAGCPVGGVVLDPFFGSGTTGAVAQSLGREYIGIELNPEYVELSKNRIAPTLI